MKNPLLAFSGEQRGEDIVKTDFENIYLSWGTNLFRATWVKSKFAVKCYPFLTNIFCFEPSCLMLKLYVKGVYNKKKFSNSHLC